MDVNKKPTWAHICSVQNIHMNIELGEACQLCGAHSSTETRYCQCCGLLTDQLKDDLCASCNSKTITLGNEAADVSTIPNYHNTIA